VSGLRKPGIRPPSWRAQARLCFRTENGVDADLRRHDGAVRPTVVLEAGWFSLNALAVAMLAQGLGQRMPGGD
jgi:hypothetical protein